MQIECNTIRKKLLKNSLITLFSTLSIVSFTVFAGGTDRAVMPTSLALPHYESPWLAIISAGYTNYSNMYSNDGQTAVARLAVARKIYAHDNWVFGLEFGVQTGNTMRLAGTQAAFNLFGGNAPIQVTVKPSLDLLATFTKPLEFHSVFLIGKAGIVYRRFQFDNVNTVNDLSQINFETQLGIGYQINPNTNVSLLYQGIFGGNPDINVNATTGTGTISNIPIQNGVLLSWSTSI